MGIDPEFMKTIDAARDDSVNLRVGVLNQSIIDTHEYSLEAVLTNVDTREETHLVGEELPGGLGVKYSIPVELVSKRSKYLLDLGDGHVVSVYVTKRSVEHVLIDGGVFYFAGAASEEGGEEDEGDEDMVFVIKLDNSTGALDKTWSEIKEAFMQGKTCIVLLDDTDDRFTATTVNSIYSKAITPFYAVNLVLYYETTLTTLQASTSSENGYPAIQNFPGN